jgi:hypothetical protein
MKLSDVYDLGGWSKGRQYKNASISSARYPSNIVLHFSGTAHVQVYIKDVLVEEGLSKDKYTVSNFADVPFPYEIYPYLTFVVDVPYTLSYNETSVTKLVKSGLMYKQICHPLEAGSEWKFMMLYEGAIEFSNEKRRLTEQTAMGDAFLDRDFAVIEGFDLVRAVDSIYFDHLNGCLLFHHDLRHNIYMHQSTKMTCIPSIIVLKMMSPNTYALSANIT